VEYPVLPSTVDCGGVVGFILTLKDQVFSLILYNSRRLFSNTFVAQVERVNYC